MQVKTDGLVIRRLNVGESDMIVTLLTRDRGVVRASAKGARNFKNRLSPACALLSHSAFTLYQGREKYIINEAEPLNVFMGVRNDIDRLALAQYLCELEECAAPKEAQAEDYLRLALNALHLADGALRPPDLIKAACEMRLMTMAGYMPDLVACRGCGAYESEEMYFLPADAQLVCGECARGDAANGAAPGMGGIRLSRGALAASQAHGLCRFRQAFFLLAAGCGAARACRREREICALLPRPQLHDAGILRFAARDAVNF
jgi:DNA repair protein RecO (recombination protein O)